ncbi:MAG TPA: VCBS repeat-containing protein [Polyangiaceae bacterium]|nr:VCBS repeat-containing protein [Polyangiaceae bacterium]
MVYILGSNINGTVQYTPVDLTVVSKMIEFTNRAWGDAGIRFTFDEVNGVEYLYYDDLNCYNSHEANPTDTSLAESLASFSAGSVPVIFFSYRSSAIGQECTPTQCVVYADNTDSCYDSDGNVGCHVYAWGNYCATASYFTGGPACFDTSDPQYPCRIQPCVYPEGSEVLAPVMIGTHGPGSSLGAFPHEFAHHFGLAHPFDQPDRRCYDRPKTDLSQGCFGNSNNCQGQGNTLPDGGGTACGSSDMPWKNVVSYHPECYIPHGGTYHGHPTSSWNSSLSHDQIEIVWRTLNEYWDKQRTSWDDDPVPHYGAAEHFFVTRPPAPTYPTSSAMGFDDWDEMYFFQTGETSWTKGSVGIVQGDFNGDGIQDAIVSTPGGAHPGTSYYYGSSLGYLTYVRTLKSDAYVTNARVLVGDFRGDKCDDVLIQTRAGAWEHEGITGTLASGGPSSIASSYHSSWNAPPLGILPVIVLGDFEGDFNIGTPLPSPWAQDYDNKAQQSYDDALVVTGNGVTLYRGSATGLGFTGSFLSSSYSNWTFRARSANVWGDHHDELIVHGPAGLEVFKGQQLPFSLSTSNRLMNEPLINSTANVELVVGNFSADYHADFITSVVNATSYNGSRLWSGRWDNGPHWEYGDWARADLYPGTAMYEVADVLRGAFDDLLIITAVGSFIYAGQPTTSSGDRTFIPNAWADYSSQFAISQAQWFGR